MSLRKELISRRALLIQEASRRIFGGVAAELGNRRSHRKLFKLKPKGPGLMKWYDPNPWPRAFDESVIYRKEKLQILKDTGRTPPAKGQGKRARK
mmetsp:Transcript_32451/g.45232  ORF Transcript_32451/g.45232 Transcript_32451/m.45232 type:complete len:95 (+) Transcript_32451:73-357(+)